MTMVFRIRNGAAASHDALSFLDQAYFVPSWQYLHDKMRYASGCLERPDWKALRGVFKGVYTGTGWTVDDEADL